MLPALFSGPAPNFPSLERWRWYLTLGRRGDILSWQGTFGPRTMCPGGHLVLGDTWSSHTVNIQSKCHFHMPTHTIISLINHTSILITPRLLGHMYLHYMHAEVYVFCVFTNTVVSRKRAHGQCTLYFMLRQGGEWIFVISLHFTTKKRPCLHYHSLHRILHTNTSVQYCWQPWSSGLLVVTRRSSSPASYAYHEAMNRQSVHNRVQQTAKAHHRNSSGSGSRRNTVGHVPREMWRVCSYFLARNNTITCKLQTSGSILAWGQERTWSFMHVTSQVEKLIRSCHSDF